MYEGSTQSREQVCKKAEEVQGLWEMVRLQKVNKMEVIEETASKYMKVQARAIKADCGHSPVLEDMSVLQCEFIQHRRSKGRKRRKRKRRKTYILTYSSTLCNALDISKDLTCCSHLLVEDRP